jgi:hypothetical protein
VSIMLAQPLGYWHDTERQIRCSTYLDRLAAAAVNLANRRQDLEPFGTLPPDPQRVAS